MCVDPGVSGAGRFKKGRQKKERGRKRETGEGEREG